MHHSFHKKTNVRLMRQCLYAAIFSAFFMILLKTYAWISTQSLSLLSSLIDSIIDMASSFINLYAIHRSFRPANKEYSFGQTKAESLAALGQSFFIGGSALFLLEKSFERFLKPEILEGTTLGMSVMILTTLCTLGLVLFQRYVIKKTKSLAIQADALHYKGDLLMNLGVFLALLLSRWLQVSWIDPTFAFFIALYILYTSFKIGKSAMDILMDKELPEEIRHKILSLVFSHNQVKGIHDLRTRSGGIKQFIQLHIELDGHLTLSEAHQIAEQIEQEIRLTFPDTEVIIHQDLYTPEKIHYHPFSYKNPHKNS